MSHPTHTQRPGHQPGRWSITPKGAPMTPTPEYQRKRRARLAVEAGREPGRVGAPTTHPCGTNAAYKRHQRHGEQPCAACRAAWSAYQRELYQRRKSP